MLTDEKPPPPSHFRGRDALGHVIEAQSQAIIASAEIHGAEIPGHISAGADAARETAVLWLLLWALVVHLGIALGPTFFSLGIFIFGWLIWKTGRATWLAWSRLERLHRIIAEERWEIEHHRNQERDELKELYRAKGFQGKLLDDVIDVLMADGDRLLRVMLEEELGLSLGVHEHPLKQGLGAGVGVLLTGSLCLLGTWLDPLYGTLAATLFVIGLSAALSALFEKNRVIPAIVWNLGLSILAVGCLYFLLDFFVTQ